MECLKCNTKTKNQKYCSVQCQKDYEYTLYIKRWFEGKETGTYANGFKVSNYVRRYLWEIHDNQCSRCGWNTPNPVTGKPILEVEHLDGNSENNKPENLDLICPNCHSLTPTYKALNKGNGNQKRLKYNRLK
jgi:Zn finger protein HypA/HybF involved in hydrogenase expression